MTEILRKIETFHLLSECGGEEQDRGQQRLEAGDHDVGVEQGLRLD